MAAVEAWLEDAMRRSGGILSGCSLYPCGRTTLKKEADKYCGKHWGRLTPEHCMRLHSRFTAMRKELGELSTEFGMLCGPGWAFNTQWPYAAIARVVGGKIEAGWLIVPGAISCPYYVRHSFSIPGSRRGMTFRSLRTVDEMIPVNKPVSGGRVTLTRNDVAREPDVRRGDAYLYDLTREHSPTVVVEGRYIGRAVQFGSLDEMIDAVRCRLVFDSLPSA